MRVSKLNLAQLRGAASFFITPFMGMVMVMVIYVHGFGIDLDTIGVEITFVWIALDPMMGFRYH